MGGALDGWIDGGFVDQSGREKKRKNSEKGRINKVLRPLSVLQVVFLLRTFAAYVTV